MQVSSVLSHLSAPPIAQENNANKGKQKAPMLTPQAPIPTPIHSSGTEKTRDSITNLQEQRIHSAFTALTQMESSSGAIVEAKKVETELLSRLGKQQNSEKITLEPGPLAGGWPGRSRNRIKNAPPNWQGLQCHSPATNNALANVVNEISKASDGRIGPHITVEQLSANSGVINALRSYVMLAEHFGAQPHSLRDIFNHLLNN